MAYAEAACFLAPLFVQRLTTCKDRHCRCLACASSLHEHSSSILCRQTPALCVSQVWSCSWSLFSRLFRALFSSRFLCGLSLRGFSLQWLCNGSSLCKLSVQSLCAPTSLCGILLRHLPLRALCTFSHSLCATSSSCDLYEKFLWALN